MTTWVSTDDTTRPPTLLTVEAIFHDGTVKMVWLNGDNWHDDFTGEVITKPAFWRRAQHRWLRVDEVDAPSNTLLEVITPRGYQRELIYRDNLWWIPDNNVYVYKIFIY